MEISLTRWLQLKPIAEKIRRARKQDIDKEKDSQNSEKHWINDRSALEILHDVRGLQFLFEHVRTEFPEHPHILFVGESTGVGIAQLRENPLTKGIRIFATTLRRTQTIEENVGKENLYVTSAEQMKIPKNSMTSIISVYGITYADPEFSMAGVHNVLMDGGVFKATFYENASRGATGALKFVQELNKLGPYGIVVKPLEYGRQLVVAVKNRPRELAIKLLESDMRNCDMH